MIIKGTNMQDHFIRFACYNEWANRRLFEAVSRLDTEAYFRDLDAFFDSVHGTLNHILVGDRAWMARIEKQGPVPSSLDQSFLMISGRCGMQGCLRIDG